MLHEEMLADDKTGNQWPAAAVIPAPLAYAIIVAVKRLVVGLNTKNKKNNNK
jgi:hypothetical protein